MRIALGYCGLVAALTLCGCGKTGSESASGSSVTAPSGWKEVELDDGKFTIKTPGEPVSLTNRDASATKAWGVVAPNLSYSIRYTELPDPNAVADQDKIEAMFDDFAETLPITDGIDVQEVKKQISFAGVSGREIDGTTADKKSIRIRICVVGGRRYRADVTGANEAVNSPDAEVFFNSLRIAR
jgi:hypothetical protein